MTKTSDIEALAGRCEALTDFETPKAVALRNAIHDLLPEPKCVQPPDYLRSLDAAMSLVLEGATWSVGDWSATGQGSSACCYPPAEMRAADGCYISKAFTPALALCAAALRARKEQTP